MIDTIYLQDSSFMIPKYLHHCFKSYNTSEVAFCGLDMNPWINIFGNILLFGDADPHACAVLQSAQRPVDILELGVRAVERALQLPYSIKRRSRVSQIHEADSCPLNFIMNRNRCFPL